MRWSLAALLPVLTLLLLAVPADADLILNWDNGTGLSATAVFEQLAPRQLQVTLTNTSTALPAALGGDSANSNQILTSFSFSLPGGIEITGGTAVLGEGAVSLNFDDVDAQLVAGDDASPEWGFGNDGGTINLASNFVSCMTNHTTPFTTSGNLDGPSNLDGPQGGLVATPPLVALGGQGAIQGPLVFALDLSGDVNLNQFSLSGATIEFGSDAAFVSVVVPDPVPEPGPILFLCTGGVALLLAAGRRRLAVKA